jgi:hypothetical protein
VFNFHRTEELMKIRSVRPRDRVRPAALFGIVLVAFAINASAQSQQPKRFLGGPLVLEDQGSFFIGGVPKITEHSVSPAAPPNAPAPAPTPHQITIGQMYVQFRSWATTWCAS